MTFYTNRPITGEHSGGRTPAYATEHGNRKTRAEEVADFISVVDAVDTPVLNELQKVPSQSEYYEWPVDKFENPSDVMGTLPNQILASTEDQQIDPTTPDSRTMLANYSHQAHVDYAVTNWQRRTNEFGISDELAYQKFKAFINLGRRFEFIHLFSQTSNPEAGGYLNPAEATMSQQRREHGIFGWGLSTGDQPGTNVNIAGRLIPANEYRSTYYAGTGNDMLPEEFYDNMLDPFVLGGGDVSSLVFFTSFKVKRVMSAWSMVYQGGGQAHPMNERNVSAASSTLYDHVDVFETDYGRVEVQPCRILSNSATRTGYGADWQSHQAAPGGLTLDPTKALIGMDPSYFDVTVQEDYYTIRLARTGPQSREALWGHMGLRCHNPKALIVGLNLAS